MSSAPRITMLISALLGTAAYPAASIAGEDAQAEREGRRIEAEACWQQELGRRDMENRERAQVEALRAQEEAIRRMEATQLRLEADSQRMNQQSADQARMSSYPYYPYSVPVAPASPALVPPPPPAVVAEPRLLPDRARHDDPVGGISFAPLSERLKSYFGAQSGVLVVSAGSGAPFGLQDGDVIVAVDGRVPADDEQVAQILRSYRPGERVKLRVQRDRRVIDLDSTAPGQRGN